MVQIAKSTTLYMEVVSWVCSPVPIRNKIDYILLNNFRNIIKRIAIYPGADIHSDYSPLVTGSKHDLFQRPSSATHKWTVVWVTVVIVIGDTSNLNAAEVKEKIKRDLNNKLSQLSKEANSTVNVNTQWNEIEQAVLDVSMQHLKVSAHKENAMNDERYLLMERRRLSKNIPSEYKRLQSIIKKEIRSAKALDDR